LMPLVITVASTLSTVSSLLEFLVRPIFFEGLCNLRSGNSVGGTAKLRLLGIPYSWSSIHPGGPIALQET
jgi:hypothetical protein